MTPSLAQTQGLFQNRLLSGAPEIKDHLVNGGPFLGVYDRAYKARLFEVLAEDFPATHTLLGDDSFAEAVDDYLNAHPSEAKSIRWIGRHFSTWLSTDERWRKHAVLAEMAAFEWALGLAFDAPDDETLTVDGLAAVPPDAWPHLTFTFHPSFNTLALTYEVAPFQQAVANERDPESAPEQLVAGSTWAVWRDPQSLIVNYRPLSEEEAWGLEILKKGGAFAALCETLAETGNAENAALKAAGYLRNWIEAGWITGLDGVPMSWPE